jgi:hypothetical protein
MAAHLDMSRANLDKLVSDGVVTRERDGRINPDAVRVAYIRHLRRVTRLNPHTESRARLVNCSGNALNRSRATRPKCSS